jgi:tight adherence protein B
MASTESCSTLSGSREAELQDHILLAVLGVTALLGATLFWVRRAERRRDSRRQRLQVVAGMAPSAEGPGLSLRRPQPKPGVRNLLLLSALRARLDTALAATGDRIGVAHLALAGVVAAAPVIAITGRALALSAYFVVVLGAAAAVGGAFLLLNLAQIRYRNRFLKVFPDALDLIGRAVKAGLPAFDAMEVAAHDIPDPVGGEFRRTLDEMRIGTDIDDALQHTADRIQVPDFRFYVVALALQRRTGGSLAETLANLSNVIRRRKEVRLKARALTAEAKMSAGVLAVLPFFVGGMLYLLNRDLMSVLFDDPRGRFMLGVAFVSLATGIAVMVLIIKRSLR